MSNGDEQGTEHSGVGFWSLMLCNSFDIFTKFSSIMPTPFEYQAGVYTHQQPRFDYICMQIFLDSMLC